MPDSLELPGMLSAVVELVSGQWRASRVVDEFVALAFRRAARARGFSGRRSGLMPGFAAVVGALDDLAEPSAGLRGVDAIGIGRRSLQVVEFPSREVGATDVPLIALAIGRKNECSLARA